jgi:hypothetical protein
MQVTKWTLTVAPHLMLLPSFFREKNTTALKLMVRSNRFGKRRKNLIFVYSLVFGSYSVYVSIRFTAI